MHTIVSNSNITIINDNLLKISLIIPDTVGSYEVKISRGSNSINGIFDVKDYSSVEVGDIIYSDSTTSSKDDELVTGKIPVAVVVGFNSIGAMLGLG